MTLLLLHFSQFAFSQNKFQEIDIINQKAADFFYKPDSMVIYARKAHLLSVESKYDLGEAKALRFLATYEHYKSNFAKALKLHFEALHIFEANTNKLEIAKSTLSIAMVYSNWNNHVNSLKYGLKTLKLFEELNDLKGQGKALNLIGISCAKQGDFKQAKKYFLQYNTLSIRSKSKDTVDLAFSYNNLGGVNRDLKLLDSALYYFKIGNYLFTKKNYLQGIALAEKNIASVYYLRKDYRKAIIYNKKSVDASFMFGDRRNASLAYQQMAACYTALKDTANAYKYYHKALDIAKVIKEREVIRDVNMALSEFDKSKENYKSAYNHIIASRSAHDSLLNTEKTKIIQDLTTKYETVKKEETIKSLKQKSIIQNLELKQRKTYLIVALCMFIISVFLAYLLFSRRQLKAKTALQAEINRQQDIAARAVLDAEERERRRIAGDLHDGVGQMLSAALMNMNGLYKKLNLTTDEDLQAQKTLALINESYDEMRSISHQMMPNALIKAGLASAVKEFLDKIDKDIIKINLETVGLKHRINEQTETVLYRVIQETVNNVIKHSAANKLDIVIIKDEEGVSATIEDNGKGFDKTKIKKDGIGIGNIYSRVAFLKGTVDIDTFPGKGTLVAIHIPE